MKRWHFIDKTHFDIVMRHSEEYRAFLEEYYKSHEMSKNEAFEAFEDVMRSVFAFLYECKIGMAETAEREFRLEEDKAKMHLEVYQAFRMISNALKELGWADDD